MGVSIKTFATVTEFYAKDSKANQNAFLRGNFIPFLQNFVEVGDIEGETFKTDDEQFVKLAKTLNIKHLTKQTYNAYKQFNELVYKVKTPAVPNSGIDIWLQSDDTGLSSGYMAYVYNPAKAYKFKENNHPYDSDDLSRCIKFVAAVPDAVNKFNDIAKTSPVWEQIISNWDKLQTLTKTEQTSMLRSFYELKSPENSKSTINENTI